MDEADVGRGDCENRAHSAVGHASDEKKLVKGYTNERSNGPEPATEEILPQLGVQFSGVHE